MDNKELKKMNRLQLLEVLYEQQTRIEELERENKELASQLEQRRIVIGNAGSIADASLALTNVFEEAQKAADMYLDSIQYIYESIRSGKIRYKDSGALKEEKDGE
ncbi:MAG: DNA repair protein [Oscillospiraceae bacterium]|nr:DNA repair protein [Oscillospiraceae bacterium]